MSTQDSGTLVRSCDCAIRQNFEKLYMQLRGSACKTNAPDAAEFREERLHGGCQIEKLRIGASEMQERDRQSILEILFALFE